VGAPDTRREENSKIREIDALAVEVGEPRKRFLQLVAEIRPDLHRYCARMTGSTSEAEDIVQETLARAYFTLPEMDTRPSLRSWLFQIAHSRAIDHLRRYDRRMGRPLDDLAETTPDDLELPEDAIARHEIVRGAIALFLELPPLPRSCVILKDVLGHSVEEIAALLDQSSAATKAALHRGRLRLRSLRDVPPAPPVVAAPFSDGVVRYAALFNARDWDGVRALLADEVRLDLVSRSQRAGRRDVGGYVTNYARFPEWYLVPARLDGREVVAGFRSELELKPSYYIELGLDRGLVTSIRDFRYVPYICVDAAIEVAERPPNGAFSGRRSP
jgi:RNA polymerase sigma factor (sigma-70 family)